ncbi:T6SS immunity protein Tli4 family protein, partial [Pantoea leporis]
QWHKKEPEVKSLLSRFSPRELYEVPTKQGFCIPYGFIANDSGHESHNMAVTYRLKDHPDVTILFQTLTSDPGPGNNRPKFDMTEKEYVTEFWNRIYGAKFRDIKLYGKGFSYPKIDGRKAVAAFAKFTRYDKSVDYGYVAYVKGKTPDEP